MPPSVPGKTNKLKRRDPRVTREAILTAARTILAKDGPEGLSVLNVARLAGVNRNTAYLHFSTKEELVKAVLESVSTQLSNTIFGKPDEEGKYPDMGEIPVHKIVDYLVDFAVENPELGRIWLFEMLASENPGEDLFFKQFKVGVKGLAAGKFGQEGIDAEVLAVLVLVGYFLCPIWIGSYARSHASSKKARQVMAKRISREILRLSLYGVLRPEFFPEEEKLFES